MILLVAVVVGLLAALLRAGLFNRPLSILSFRHLWLVPMGMAIQGPLFHWPLFQQAESALAATFLVGSQALLLLFAWGNRRLPGFPLLTLGLCCNLLAISANGGLMPVSPETAARLTREPLPGVWQVGERLGTTKEIVLPEEAMRFSALSDRFLIDTGLSYRAAVSLGDLIIACGAVLLLWSLGAPPQNTEAQWQRPQRPSLSPARPSSSF